MSTILKMSMLNIMNNLIKMTRIIDVFSISLVCINSLDCSQLITMKLSLLVKTSLKKNIIMRNITMNMNIIMIKKKMSTRWIQKRICSTRQPTTVMLLYLSWISLKNQPIILIYFMHTSLLIYISAVYVRQLLHWIINYINMFNLFMTISRSRQRSRNSVQSS